MNGYQSSYDDSDYLAAPRPPGFSKRNSAVSSNNDGDSLFDLYGNRNSVVGGFSNGSDPAAFSSNTAEFVHNSDPEASKWIHRDKLAKIEGNEAQDYLFDVESSRWIHKDKLEMIEIQELQKAGLPLPVIPTSVRRESEQRGRDEQQRDLSPEDEDYNIMDPRTPEEQAMDRSYFAPHKSCHRNRSYSRIPVAHSSPHPVPEEYIQRTSPLPRSQTTPSGSEDGRSITHPSARKRSHSAGSTMLLDENTPAQQPITPTPAPGKVINPKTRGPASGNKNTLRQSSMASKQRTKSNPQLHRPSTSASYSAHGGPSTPGSTRKYPEGPPPWAVQSYKPDPSLPPDQQIIPTVAKRMQQEQWERDGVAASIYDRELRPMKVADTQNAETVAARQSIQQDGVEWPLKSPTLKSEPSPPPNEQQMVRPPPPPTQPVDGGYSTMPPVSLICEWSLDHG